MKKTFMIYFIMCSMEKWKLYVHQSVCPHYFAVYATSKKYKFGGETDSAIR